ncbi:MAG TPA: hypothetical protein VF790_05365 [Dissulfurispiraceae bacterium]
MSAEEDRRTAVGMSVTLSSQLIAASLAMLAIEGGYVAYVLGNRQPSRWFVFLAIIAGVSFIASIVIAGKAITASRNAGFDGRWNLDSGRNFYRLQAAMCYAGLLLFGIMLFLSGKPAKDVLAEKMEKLEARVTELERQGTSRGKQPARTELKISISHDGDRDGR